MREIGPAELSPKREVDFCFSSPRSPPGQYWIKKQGKGENVLFPTDSTDSPRAGHTSSVRLYRGGNRTTDRERPGADPLFSVKLEGELESKRVSRIPFPFVGLGALGPGCP